MTIPSTPPTHARFAAEFLTRLGVAPSTLIDGTLPVRSPITGERLATLREHTPEEASSAMPNSPLSGGKPGEAASFLPAPLCSSVPRSRAFLHPTDWFRAFDVERMDDHM